MLTGWLGFFLALAALLLISQRNLAVAMFVGAFILGVITIPDRLPAVLWAAITDPSTILLAVIVGIIPLIGGILKESGQMDNLVSNMRIGKKAFLMLSPALVGMLPMPGGALLSAPLVEKGESGISNDKKAGLNVWFRHILYLVYPMAPTLIISSEAARIDLYQAIPYMTLTLVFSLFLGYFFFIKDATGKMNYAEKFSLRKLMLPLTALLAAPILDIVIKTFFVLPVKELATLIGISVSLLISIMISGKKTASFTEIFRKAKVWSFASMMIGIMVFLAVFKNSGILLLIRNLYISKEALFVIGLLLGFSTGRIITPAGIVFPIAIEKFGAISLPFFAILYFSIFLGYIMTPVHPCVSLSVEAFKANAKGYFKAVAPPALIGATVSLIILYITNP